MNTIINGNILDTIKGIIVHQTNCKGFVGGLAGQIAARYPEWEQNYIAEQHELGNATLFDVNDKLTIANLYGQYNPGPNTNHKALKQALMKLAELTKNDQRIVYLPYMIGCGIGGGDWNVVSRLIEEILPKAILVRYI